MQYALPSYTFQLPGEILIDQNEDGEDNTHVKEASLISAYALLLGKENHYYAT